MKTWVCDWTHWQARTCPAANIQAEGFSMVKLKIGGAIREGWSFIDPSFAASVAAVRATQMIPAGFWYLMPGQRGASQAALLHDTLRRHGGWSDMAVFLDVEQMGLVWDDIFEFHRAWRLLSGGHPLHMYTRRSFWEPTFTQMGQFMFPFLEEAHYVSADVRTNPQMPYASQQAKHIDPDWWNLPPRKAGSTHGYGGWTRANMLQFTDYALVDRTNADGGKRVPASLYLGTPAQLRAALLS